MKWLEITVITNRELSDLVSLTLIEEGSEGTVIRDNADFKELNDSGIIWDYIDENLIKNCDPRVFVSGFFSVDANASKIVERLDSLRDNSQVDVGAFEVSLNQIDSGDWENEWKKYYMPIEFSTFAIVPEWIKNHGIENKKIILLNPGMAFGTGSHETTSMCLKLMEGIDFEGKTVIDLGCGSGILGITAAVLDAKLCVLTDIDPYAVRCATENAQLNGLDSSIKILKADLLNESINSYLFEQPKDELKADILTANLTAPLLLMAKSGIKKHLKQDGLLIISGILADYNQEVIDSYEEDFHFALSLTNGDWRAHMLRKKTEK